MDSRFFDTTRGQLIGLLRNSPRTVNELADALNISDNAVRAHLMSLERDNLVKRSGTVKGYRKPHYTYALTPAADKLFPKAYDSLFIKLVSVIKRRLSPAAFLETLSDLGRSVAGDAKPASDADLDARVEQTVASIESLGGLAVATKHDDAIVIQSEKCLFADAVAENPEVCKVVEAIVTDIVGAPATERCDRNGPPKCRFRIETSDLPQ